MFSSITISKLLCKCSSAPVGLEDVSKYPDLFATLLASGMWTMEELKQSILALAVPARQRNTVAVGFLSNPVARDRGACRAIRAGPGA